MPAGGPSGTCPPNNTPCFTPGDVAWHNANVIVIQGERDDIQDQLTTKDGQLTAAKNNRDYAVANQCPM